jgi:2-dehydro-3-deoxyphosphogluconate aldolase/(4S)-4-hydroxy-2-oxoglutarate aldolase
MLKALHGPYPGVSFMPTGGITATDAADWLALPNAAAVGGTWIAPREAIAEGAFEAIAENARRAHEIRASLRTPSPSQA